MCRCRNARVRVDDGSTGELVAEIAVPYH